MSKQSQAERIHDILRKGKTVSSFDGRIDGREAYGILDVPKRISELRQKYGRLYIDDRTERVVDRYGNKARVKVYWLNPKYLPFQLADKEQPELIPKPKDGSCTVWQ